MSKNESTKYYLNQAKVVANKADDLLQSVKNCLTESEMFPIYLKDLQEMVNTLMYLNAAHNAVQEEHFWDAPKNQNWK